jgi:hypothetical protein
VGLAEVVAGGLLDVAMSSPVAGFASVPGNGDAMAVKGPLPIRARHENVAVQYLWRSMTRVNAATRRLQRSMNVAGVLGS